MVKKIFPVILFYLCIVFLMKIFFDCKLVEKKETDEIYSSIEEEKFDPIQYDLRFSFIDDINYRNAVFHYGKNLSYYINDPYGFLIALSCVESSFGKHLHGKDGERGLFQIHPYWKKVYNLEEMHLENPEINVYVAIDILTKLFKTYGDPFIALNVYNTGSNKKKNKKYINRFLECYAKINF